MSTGFNQIGKLNPPSGLLSGGMVSPYIPEANAYFLQVVANGGADFSAPWKIFWNNIISNMVSTGSFQELDRLFSFYNEHLIAARTSIVNPSTSLMAVMINAPVFTSASGIVTDGATNYIDLMYSFTTNCVKYTKDYAFWGYGFDGRVAGNGGSGLLQAPGFTIIYPQWFGSNVLTSINDLSTPGTAMAGGLDADYIMKRTNSANLDYYKDNVLTNVVAASTDIPGLTTPYLGASQQGGPGAFEAENLLWNAAGSGAINAPQFRADFTTQLTGM